MVFVKIVNTYYIQVASHHHQNDKYRILMQNDFILLCIHFSQNCEFPWGYLFRVLYCIVLLLFLVSVCGLLVWNPYPCLRIFTLKKLLIWLLFGNSCKLRPISMFFCFLFFLPPFEWLIFKSCHSFQRSSFRD